MKTGSATVIGFWFALASLLLALGYIVPQIFSTLGVLPSPYDKFWLFLPSLFLAPVFLVTMICLHYASDEIHKIWTAIGGSFAIVYCVMVTIIYFTQLAVVLPLEYKNEINETNVLIFERKTFLMAVDCLGYFFMSLSTLFAAFAFRGDEHKWLFRGLFWNGALIPVLIIAFFHPVFYYVGAVWMITFPLAMIQAALYLYRSERIFILVQN